MQLIHNGIRYNTANSEEVARALSASSTSSTTVSRWDETLYRTGTGRYFVHGYGGLGTRWEQSREGILPMSPSDVLAWMKANKVYVPEECPEVYELVKNA